MAACPRDAGGPPWGCCSAPWPCSWPGWGWHRGRFPTTPQVVNPAGIADADAVLDVLELVGNAGFGLATLAALCAPVVRYRHANHVERQQLKWFALAAVLILAAWALAGGLQQGGADPETLSTIRLAPLMLLPPTIAVAVLQYRLYDIDRLISRTVAYGLLTALLVGVYTGGVLLMGRLLTPLGADTDLAVATATLAAAVIGAPARRRIQSMVDRRFDRAAYDAKVVVAAFRDRLRDSADPEHLTAQTLATAHAVVAPQAASMWLPAGGPAAPAR